MTKSTRNSDKPEANTSVKAGQRRRLSHDLDVAAAEPSLEWSRAEKELRLSSG